MENVLAVSRTPKFLAGGLQLQRGIKLRYLFEGASWLRPAVGRGESVFPYLRLVLADKDAKRGRFNMKEKRLAEMYTAGLAISGEHPDAKNLVDWKAPQAAKPAGGRKRGDGARAVRVRVCARAPGAHMRARPSLGAAASLRPSAPPAHSLPHRPAEHRRGDD